MLQKSLICITKIKRINKSSMMEVYTFLYNHLLHSHHQSSIYSNHRQHHRCTTIYSFFTHLNFAPFHFRSFSLFSSLHIQYLSHHLCLISFSIYSFHFYHITNYQPLHDTSLPKKYYFNTF